MTIYQLVTWARAEYSPKEFTVGVYESWKDANLEKCSREVINVDYEYTIYTCKVIPDSEKGK